VVRKNLHRSCTSMFRQRGTLARRLVQPSARLADNMQPAASKPWAQPGYEGAFISSLPESQQTAFFLGVYAVLGVGTWLTTSYVAPHLASIFPAMASPEAVRWPFAAGFLIVGILHFTATEDLMTIYPHEGAWGL